jgi:predicted RNA-binding Zn-ribbon protein involved in translation (DUF1610 family)
MTPQEAIKELECAVIDANAYDVCKNALEKQVAKKPVSDISFFKCPSCSSWDIEECYDIGGSKEHNYCPDCGQKLLWN